MKLDATDLRYITTDEFRVLTATEIGSKNHEVVPTHLIAELSGLRGGQVNKLCGALAKRNLIARVVNARYDGYRLTYGGLDYLALRTFSRRSPPSVAAVGQRVGVGKESDIMIVSDETGEQRILKMHRLGRISFRAIKSKRDYLRKGQSASWMYMSRLSAQKEFAFMKVLYNHGFPVPTPIDQARHCVVMSYVDSVPLRALEAADLPDPAAVAALYAQLMALLVRLGRAGLIHGDYNEFNILVRRKDGEPVVIDFPQMVSTRHENAEFFFNRDVNCIRKFFRKRFRFEAASWPVWNDVIENDDADDDVVAVAEGEASNEGEGGHGDVEAASSSAPSLPDGTLAAPAPDAGASPKRVHRLRLDLEVEASGFGRAMQRELEDYMIDVQDMPASDYSDDENDEDDEEDEEEEEETGAEQAEGEAGETQRPTDPDMSEEATAARLEALRLHRALGNTDDGSASDTSASESDVESDAKSDVGSANSAVRTDYTQYVRPVRAVRPRPRKLDDIDEVRSTVAAQVARQRAGGARAAGGGGGGSGGGAKGKAKAKVGNMKGHKWKHNAAHQVARGSVA
ncbi:Serine/threonine-protein kinase rio2 [Cryptotrichosporon argae]